jgi:hypothetical protein
MFLVSIRIKKEIEILNSPKLLSKKEKNSKFFFIINEILFS